MNDLNEEKGTREELRRSQAAPRRSGGGLKRALMVILALVVVLAVVVAAAQPLVGILWLMVRIFAPEPAKIERTLDNTPGLFLSIV